MIAFRQRLETRLGRPGFTLVELLVVIAIVATLLTIAVPRYFASVERSKEAVLKENLAVMRDAVQKYYGDKGKYPERLEELAAAEVLAQNPRGSDDLEQRDVGHRAAEGIRERRRVRLAQRRVGQRFGRYCVRGVVRVTATTARERALPDRRTL